MIKPDIDLCIFDWDGTLMNSLTLIVDSLSVAAQAVSLPVLQSDRYKSIIGLGLQEAYQNLYPEQDMRLFEAYKTAYAAHFVSGMDRSSLYDGVISLLERIQDQGIKMAIATGKSRAGLDRVLAQSPISAFFLATRCADETASKPNPMMLKEISEELNVDPHRSAMIGDTTFDLEMARHAGMFSVGVSYGAHPIPDLLRCEPLFVADKPLDILKLF